MFLNSIILFYMLCQGFKMQSMNKFIYFIHYDRFIILSEEDLSLKNFLFHQLHYYYYFFTYLLIFLL